MSDRRFPKHRSAPAEDPEIAGLDQALGEVLDALREDDFALVRFEVHALSRRGGTRLALRDAVRDGSSG